MNNDRRAFEAAIEAAEPCIESVVLIFMRLIQTKAIVSKGTGFIGLSSNGRGLVFTCNHCLKDEYDEPFDQGIHDIFIRLSGGEHSELQAEMLYGDAQRDVALLRVSGLSRPDLSFVDLEYVPKFDDVLVAIGFVIPDRDEDESTDEDEDEDDEDEDEEDGVLVYPNEPGLFDGTIASDPSVLSNNPLHETLLADCGLMAGCSGGPVLFNNCVMGMATHTTNQLDVILTAASMRAVLQTWGEIDPDDTRDISELLEDFLFDI